MNLLHKTSTLLLLSGLALAAQTPARVSVKDAPFFAKGDGVSDDTAAIQAAISTVGVTGGTVLVPAGTYMVNPCAVDGNKGLLLTSGVSFVMSPNTTLKATTNGASSYAVIHAQGTGITIAGGTIVGDRATHTGTAGQWGQGIAMEGCTNMTVVGTAANECWGDGFYVMKGVNVLLSNCSANHNRRQGLTLTSVNGCVVSACTFTNTQGTAPEDGIDIEPNPGETAQNVLIQGVTVSGNRGHGIEMGIPLSYTGKAFMHGVQLDSCVAIGNGSTAAPKGGFEMSNCDPIRFTNCTATSNNGWGFLIRNNANGSELHGCVATANTSDGILEYLSNGGLITGCSATNNGQRGIYLPNCTGVVQINNTVSGNKITP